MFFLIEKTQIKVLLMEKNDLEEKNTLKMTNQFFQ